MNDKNSYVATIDPTVYKEFCDSHLCKIYVPKKLAVIKIAGVPFEIYDNCKDFSMPTEEQRKNLKKLFGIEVELVKEDNNNETSD